MVDREVMDEVNALFDGESAFDDILKDCQRNYWEAVAEGSVDIAQFWLDVEKECKRYEAEHGPCADCEVCDAAADAEVSEYLGEDLCSACAAGWDDDNARSYGPRAEIERLRESRN